MKTKERIISMMLMLVALAMGTKAMAKEAYAVLSDNDKTLTFYYDNNKASYGSKAYALNTGENDPGWYKTDTHGSPKDNIIEKVVFTSGFKDARPTSTYSWFCYQENLTLIKDIEYLNTSDVTDMGYMFSHCKSITSLNLRSFDTSKVTDMRYMFKECSDLISLDATGWNTGNVTNMRSMFDECSDLRILDVTGWNTGNVTDMGYMFYGCYELTSPDIGGWNTGNVTDMSYLFSACGMTTLDLGDWDTSKVTNMFGAFCFCSCLKELDISGWNTSSVTDMEQMFLNCRELKTIYVGDGWNTDNVVYYGWMFNGCSSLKGENGTTYDKSHDEIEYAHLDGGTSNPGYFSLRKFNLWIAGIRVTRKNCSNIPYGDYAEGVSYNPSTKTLTLNNVEIDEGNYYPAIEVCNFYGLTIEVKGDCTLTSNEPALSVYDNSSVTVTGAGKLTLTSYSEPAIYVGKNTLVTLRDANVEASGADSAIKGEGDDNGYCDMVVNHSNLYAYSEGKFDATIYGLNDFTLVNAEFKDVSVEERPFIYYGAGFKYNTTSNLLRFDGQYYNTVSHQTNNENIVWDDYVIIAPQSGITTSISEAYGQRESVKGQRDERYNLSGQRVGKDYKGIVIINGKKTVVR